MAARFVSKQLKIKEANHGMYVTISQQNTKTMGTLLSIGMDAKTTWLIITQSIIVPHIKL